MDISKRKSVLSSLLDSSSSNFPRILHDDILQDIISIHNRCKKILQNNTDLPKDFAEKTRFTMNECDILIDRIRSIIIESNPSFLYAASMYDCLISLIDHCNTKSSEHSGPFFSFAAPKNLPFKDVESKRFLYRIVKEMNENALKHADASWVANELILENELLIYTIEDNGVGFHSGKRLDDVENSNMGLDSIENDVLKLHGSMTIQTRPEIEGTLITVKIPVEVLK